MNGEGGEERRTDGWRLDGRELRGGADGAQPLQLRAARPRRRPRALGRALTGLLLFSSSQSSADKIPFIELTVLGAMLGLPVRSQRSAVR